MEAEKGFENIGSIPEDDQSTIFYTAEYVSRSLLRKTKCQDCKTLLQTVDEEAPISEDAVPEEKPREEYLNIANRGGLTKPSDCMYMACIHAWGLYLCISENTDAFNSLLESCNPRSVFVHCYMEKMQLPQCSSLYSSTCSSGCKLHSYLRKVGEATFNLKAKNFAARKNDEINKLKRASTANPKKSAAAKKIKKLSSN